MGDLQFNHPLARLLTNRVDGQQLAREADGLLIRLPRYR